MNKQPIIHRASKSILLNGYVEEVLNAIPRSKRILVGGREVTAIAHSEAETLWLLEHGYEVPFPAQIHFEWPKIEGKYDPMPHQKYSVGFMAAHKKCHNLSDPRTGKTHSILLTYSYLKSIKAVNKMIVYAPLSVLETVWCQSIFDTYPHLTYTTVYGSKARRLEQLLHDVDIYVTNHDGVKTLEKELIARHDIDMVVWDECDSVTNAQTAMWKALKNTITPDMRLILASASATSQCPTDSWALAKLVSPELVPKFFGAYKRDLQIQVSPFRWINKPDATAKVFAAMQPAVCFRKTDVLKDLPKLSHERIKVELSEDQRRMYKELQKDMVTEYNGGNLNAVNAADSLGKILQVLLGSYKTPEGDYQSIDFTPRLEAVMNCIKSASKKTLIFVPYTGALRAYYKEIKKHYSCEYVDGSTSKDERARIFTSFQKDKDPQIVLAHPKTASFGVEAAAADTTIYLGPILSARQYIQSAERMNSIKQDSPMMIYYIGATKMEFARFDTMINKKMDQDSILNMYKEVLDEKI